MKRLTDKRTAEALKHNALGLKALRVQHIRKQTSFLMKNTDGWLK